ncbi:MAG TPA: hypothetical protein VH573_01460 [Mycobacteriales bacterium]|jgi:hypothetical protein
MDVGLRGVPTRPPTVPVRSGGRRVGGRLASAAVLLLAAFAILATAWLLLSALSARPAVSAESNAFAARVFAINRFGYGAGRLAWYDGGLAGLQVAGYETVTGALRRAATAVTAAREAMSIAAVLSAVALTMAARRLRLSAPAVVAVPILYGLTPAALVLHRTVDPVQLGVLWACIALALASGGARRTGTAVACAAYLALAVATSPLVLLALVPLFAMLVWSGSLGRFDGGTRLGAAVGGLAVYAGLVGLTVAGRLSGGGAGAIPDLGPLDWALAVAAIGAGVAGLRIRWLRPLAVALLATVAAAAVAPDVRGSLVLVALPLGAVVLPAATEAAVTALGRRHELWPQARVIVAGGVGIAVVVAWMPTLNAAREPAGGSEQTAAGNAQAWVLANLPSRPKLLVDDMMWARLVRSGYPAEQLTEAGGIGPDHAQWPWTEARYVVGRDEALIGASDPVGEALSRSTPVASFGDDADTIMIRRVVTAPDEVATDLRLRADRIAAGRALTANPKLELAPRAATLISAGQVDARVVDVLAAMAGQHSVRIVDFPVVPGEDAGAPRRLMAVAAVDDQAVGAGTPAVTTLDQWLRAQQPPYRPIAAGLSQLDGSPVLLIRYDALGSADLSPP